MNNHSNLTHFSVVILVHMVVVRPEMGSGLRLIVPCKNNAKVLQVLSARGDDAMLVLLYNSLLPILFTTVIQRLPILVDCIMVLFSAS